MRGTQFRYWLSFSLLAMALCLTLLSISWLKGDHSERFFNSLGLGSKGEMLNWCSNRVKTLTFPGQSGAKIIEENGQWKWQGEHATVLNYLDVEKWFAKYCQLNIEKVPFSDFNSPLNPLIEIEFINGDEATFYDLGDNRFQIQEHIFKSPKFRRAFKELLDFGPQVQ